MKLASFLKSSSLCGKFIAYPTSHPAYPKPFPPSIHPSISFIYIHLMHDGTLRKVMGLKGIFQPQKRENPHGFLFCWRHMPRSTPIAPCPLCDLTVYWSNYIYSVPSYARDSLPFDSWCLTSWDRRQISIADSGMSKLKIRRWNKFYQKNCVYIRIYIPVIFFFLYKIKNKSKWVKEVCGKNKNIIFTRNKPNRNASVMKKSGPYRCWRMWGWETLRSLGLKCHKNFFWGNSKIFAVWC